MRADAKHQREHDRPVGQFAQHEGTVENGLGKSRCMQAQGRINHSGRRNGGRTFQSDWKIPRTRRLESLRYTLTFFTSSPSLKWTLSR